MNMRYPALFCLMLTLIAGCGREPKDGPPELAQAVSAQTTTVTARDIPLLKTFPGVSRGKVVMEIAAKIPATVLDVRVDIGDRVKEGDLLIVLDDRDMTARVASFEASRDSAARRRDALSAEREYASSQYARYERLLAHDAATREEYDRAKARLDALDAQIRSVEAETARAAAGVQEARAALSYLRIHASAPGTVTARSVDPGTFAPAGSPLLAIEGEKGMWFEARIDEKLLSHVKTGDTAILEVPSAGVIESLPIEAVVTQADPQTATFPVRVDATALNIKGGVFGRLHVIQGMSPALLIPFSALVERSGITGVYLVGPDDIVRWRIVRPGERWRPASHDPGLLVPAGGSPPDADTLVEVLAGLSRGDEVVTGHPTGLKEGVRLARH